MASVGLGGLVAGCSGDSGGGGSDGDGTDDTDDGSSGTPIDPHWTSPFTEVKIQQLQWNVFNPLNYGQGISFHMFDPLAVYSPADDEFLSVLAEDWNFDRNAGTFTISIRDQTWTNDEPLTASDVATKLRLLDGMNSSGMASVSEVTVEDDSTVVMELDGDVNQDFLMHQLFGFHTLIDTPESVFGEYLEDFESASSDSEEETARQALAEFQWEDPVATGPFQIDDQSAQKLVLSKRESGHPIAEELNFDGLEFSSQYSVDTRLSGISNGELDHTNINATEGKLEQLPDHVEAHSFPWFTGIGLSFNYDLDVFEHRAFRKAVAYLLNRELATRNVAPLSNEAHEKIHGMTGVDVGTPQQILGDAWDSFDEYGYQESKTGEAEAILEDAGFTKEDDRWHKPDGERIEELEIVGPSGWSWIRMVETAAEQFSTFGIPATVRGVDASVMYDQSWPQGDFDIVTCELGGASPYPGQHFQKLFTGDLGGDAFNNPTTGMPLEFEVPNSVGDADSDTTTVNMEESIGRLSSAPSDEANTTLQEIAWVVNQAVPVLPVYDKIGYKAYDTEEWAIPSSDESVMQMVDPTKALPNLGILQAETE